MASLFAQFVSARLDYIALNREMGRSESELLALEHFCSKAVVKTIQGISRLTMEEGNAVAKLALETQDLQRELKLMIQTIIEKRMQFDADVGATNGGAGQELAPGGVAGPHMNRMQTLLHWRKYLLQAMWDVLLDVDRPLIAIVRLLAIFP